MDSEESLPSSQSRRRRTREVPKGEVRRRRAEASGGAAQERDLRPSMAGGRQGMTPMPSGLFAQLRKGLSDYVHEHRLDIGLLFCLVLFILYMSTTARTSEGENVKIAEKLGAQGFDPCCAFPCLHRGICESRGKNFHCDCTGTGYSGRTCSRPSATLWFESRFLPTMETMMKGPWKSRWFWWWVDQVRFLHLAAMKYVFLSRFIMIHQPTALNSIVDYTTFEVHSNRNVYSRHLQPVPRNCPTEMGYVGPKRLPSPEETFDRLLRRRQFIPCNRGTNLYFISYAQFFTHQFFKRDHKELGYTWGINEGVDTTIIYGQLKPRRDALRSFKDGKLKVTIIDGDDYPPLLNKDTNVFMAYPKGSSVDDIVKGGLFIRDDSRVSPKWALGHPMFSMTPMLFVVVTLWLREHNRICDMLKDKHPDWDDERLYQTARIIITGLMVKMTLTGYVQHLSQYNFRIGYEPGVSHDTCYNYYNRIEQEFVLLYHWHMMVPDVLRVEDKTYIIEELLFSNNSVVFYHGFNRFLASMFFNTAGRMTLQNHGPQVKYVGEKVIAHGRHYRLQSFNNYRRHFNLPPYKSFYDLCKNEKLAKDLEAVYQHVDAVEFYIGLFAEAQEYATTPPSMVAMGGAWSVRGLGSNPIGSPQWWKPSTFGGVEGWDVIRKTTLKDFICRNLRGVGCSKMHIAYSVPKSITRDALRVWKELSEKRSACGG